MEETSTAVASIALFVECSKNHVKRGMGILKLEILETLTLPRIELEMLHLSVILSFPMSNYLGDVRHSIPGVDHGHISSLSQGGIWRNAIGR